MTGTPITTARERPLRGPRPAPSAGKVGTCGAEGLNGCGQTGELVSIDYAGVHLGWLCADCLDRKTAPPEAPS